jgi:4-hydroxy-tetrahydrodipicolinate reductase
VDPRCLPLFRANRHSKNKTNGSHKNQKRKIIIGKTSALFYTIFMKIAIVGANGRMGAALLKACHKDARITLSAAIVRNNHADIGKPVRLEGSTLTYRDDIAEAIQESDAVIDFTTIESSLQVSALCQQFAKIHIIGTTGFNESQKQQLQAASQHIRVVHSHNYSVGINLLLHMVEQASSHLPPEQFDIEISEMHHRYKVDAPSGTALSLGEAAAKGRGVPLKQVARMERSGQTGIRPTGEIGFATLRGGEVVGEHTVLFASGSEHIAFTHKAFSRDVFAEGAIRAALWAENKPNGFYTMRDVVA